MELLVALELLQPFLGRLSLMLAVAGEAVDLAHRQAVLAVLAAVEPADIQMFRMQQVAQPTLAVAVAGLV